MIGTNFYLTSHDTNITLIREIGGSHSGDYQDKCGPGCDVTQSTGRAPCTYITPVFS
jgi:hypothetical protein